MDSPPPEDLYAVLDVAQDASQNDIKTAYRKLILKSHPDKVLDPTKKEAATDEFQKISKAWEWLSEPQNREHYDANRRLVNLRRELMESRQGKTASSHPREDSHPDNAMPRTTTTVYDFETSPDTRRATFGARVPPRYTQERKSSYVYDEQPYREEVRIPASRYDDYYSKPKPKTSPRATRNADPESARVYRKENERSFRSEKSRASDRERTRERDLKYTHVEANEIDPYDDPYRDSERARAWEREQEQERVLQETRRQRARADQDPVYDPGRHSKQRTQEDTAREYQRRSKPTSTETEPRPTASRSASAKDVSYIRHSAIDSRPTMARRSSARRADSSPSRRNKKDSDKKPQMPEIVEEPKRPDLSASYSSPAGLEDMVNGVPTQPMRSYSAQVTHSQAPIPPRILRSETAPTYPTTSNRSKRDGGYPQSSKFREPPQDSGYSSPSSPERSSFPTTTTQYPQSKGTSRYYTPGVEEEPYEYSNGRRTQRVEPNSSHRKRSLSPREHRSRPSSRRQYETSPAPTYRTIHYQYPSSTTVEAPTSLPSVHPAETPRERPSLRRYENYYPTSRHSQPSSRDAHPNVTSTSRPAFGEGGAGTTGAAVDALPPGGGGATGKSGRKSTSTAEMMTGLARNAHAHVQYAKQPKMEDIRTSNPMGSKARPSASRRASNQTARERLLRRETVY